MRKSLAAITVAIVAAAPVLGSDLEDTGVHYQFDADTTHDAPDTCEAAEPTWKFDIDGSTDGVLIPPDDESDFIVFEVTPEVVGQPVTVHLTEEAASFDLDLSVWVPDCDGDVFAPQNQPSPEPAPPEPGPGEQQATLSNNKGKPGWDCTSTKWFFVVNQLGATTPPPSILVVWTNGEQETVPLLKATPATTAQYATSSNLGFTLKEAYANVALGWKGNFNVGEGPCDAVDGEAVFGAPPSKGDDSVTFTPTVSGYHAAGITTKPITAPSSVPMNCHYCADPLGSESVKKLGYLLGATK